MNQTPSNYCEWDHHLVDICFADDGFGNTVMTPLDMFHYNNEARMWDPYL